MDIDMVILAEALTTLTLVYAVFVIMVSNGARMPRLAVTKANLYGMSFCATSLLAIICAWVDGNDDYFLIGAGILLVIWFGLVHTEHYLMYRPRSKEEGKQLASQ